MLAKGVKLEFDTPREMVVRMAHDRLMAAERVKMAVFAQSALMIHGAVAAQSESGSSEAPKRLQDMVSTYHDLLSPERVTEREDAYAKGKERLDEESAKGYRMTRVDGKDEVSAASSGARKGGLLRGRRGGS